MRSDALREPVSTRFLHVANGTCTTAIIEAAGIPGQRSIWADPLYEGPVPAGISDDELIDARAAFHGPPNGDAALDPANDMRRWRSVIDAHGDYDELVLWYEHDLFDQLNLVQVLSWIRRRLPAAKPVSLICIGAFPGRPHFKGLGELSPGELASLFDRRRPVGGAQYVLAERTWRAIRDHSPESLDALRRADTSSLPYLAPALERFLEEYPSTTDGLSRTERRLLTLAAQRPIALRDAFPRMHDGERAYYVTDSSLAELATTLSRTTPPLLTIVEMHGAGERSLRRTVVVTGAGRDVLAGQRDRVAGGIDRWLGGVHLRTGGAIWRWDTAARRIVGPAPG